MTVEEAPQWVDPYAGFQYLPDQISVSTAHQQEKLSACGISADVFADQVAPSFFVGIAIHAGIRSGISAEGNVNMLQSLIQHRPALLDETLSVTGEITAVTAVPRGSTIDTSVQFTDGQGRPVITANRRSLKPDPNKDKRGAGDRPELVIADPAGLSRLNSYQLTPEAVKTYSSEGNSIHYEMAAAQNAGFRAPLIGGGMGVHYLMSALWHELPPARFDVDIYFRRPIFWDEQITVAYLAASTSSPWRAMCLLKEGKVGTEIRLNSLEIN